MKKLYSLSISLLVAATANVALANNAVNTFVHSKDAAVSVAGKLYKGESLKQLPADICEKLQTTPMQAPAKAATGLQTISDGEPVSVTFEAVTSRNKYMYNDAIFVINGDNYAAVWMDEENPITTSVAAGTYDLLCIFYCGSWDQPLFYVDYQEGVTLGEGTKVTMSPNNATELVSCDFKLINGESPKSHYSLDNGATVLEQGNVDGVIYWLGLTHPAIGLLSNMTTFAEFLPVQGVSVNEINGVMVSPCVNNPMKYYQCFIAFDKTNIMGSGCEFDDINKGVTKTVAGNTYTEMEIPMEFSPKGKSIEQHVYSPSFYMTPVIDGKYSSTMSFSCHATNCSMQHRYFSFPESNEVNGTFFAYNPALIDYEEHMFGNLYSLFPTIARPVMPIDGEMTMIDHFGDHPFNYDIASSTFSLSPLHKEFAWPLSKCAETIGNTAPICVFYINPDDYLEINRSYRGMHNEIRLSDLYEQQLYVKYNGEVVCDDWEYLEEWAECDWMLEDNIGEYEFGFINENVAVDDIPGYNKTVVTSDLASDTPGVPTLTRMAFKNAEGVITNRFLKADEGTLMFTCADFEYQTDFSDGFKWGFVPYALDVAVEYAPYGTDEFYPLTAVADATLDRDAYGKFYSASLADVNVKSENGWYTLRFILTDAAGNCMVQELTPAFKIDSVTGIASAVANDDDAVYYNLQGMRVNNPIAGQMYIMRQGTKASKIIR